MKVKKYLSLFLILSMLVAVLCGCGGASVVYNDMALKQESAAEAPAMMAAGAANDSLNTSSPSTSAAVPENRKWIVTVYMSAETEDLDSITAALDKQISRLEGFVEDQHIYNGSAYSTRRYRSANLTIRIPAEKVDEFTQQVSGIANVVSQEKNLTDVTLTYVSTESRMKALQTEEARLLELMAQAETMSDLLEIEGRLTDVRYELESVTSQLRTFDNQINYATIHLDISEVQEYTPIEDPTLWERIIDGFTDSLEGLWESLQDLLVGLIIAAPFLVVYGSILIVVFLVIRKLSKYIRGSRDKKRLFKAQQNTKTDAEQ